MTKKSYQILDGAALAEEIKRDLAQKVSQMKPQPGLATILVGDDEASKIYIRRKEQACREVGLGFHKYLCNEDCYPDISQEQLLELIDFLNKDEQVSGIIVQLPLPKRFDQQKIIQAIASTKDADVFGSQSSGLLPPTVAAIIELLKATAEDLSKKSLLIVGKSDIFMAGLEKHLTQELKIKNIKRSQNIPENSADYDIIVIALGRAKALKKSQIKEGAILIDVGINKVDGHTVGDVDPAAYAKAAFISPVPGGVGPLTVACLLRNVYELANKLK